MRNSVQFSPLTSWVAGGHDRQFSRDSLPVFSAEGHPEQFWHGQGYPFFDIVHPFPLPTTAMATLFDSCQKRFLWTNKEFDHAPHPVIGLVLQVGKAEKFPQALGFESLNLFIRVNKQAIQEDGVDKKLAQLELACEAVGVAPPDSV